MIELTVTAPSDSRIREDDPGWLELQVDLQEFLTTLARFPRLASLGELDYYACTRIDLGWVRNLIDEAETLLTNIESGEIRVLAPEAVGQTSDEDTSTQFGLRGFVEWLKSLLAIAHYASENGIPMWALGN